MEPRTAILFDNAQMIVPSSLATIHACSPSSSEEEKIISSVEPLSMYLRIPSENTRKSVELSELQVPASGLGIEIFGIEDKRDDVRLRDVVAESSRCSVVATASVVMSVAGSVSEKKVKQEVRDNLSVQRDTSRASRESRPAKAALFVTSLSVTSILP